MPPKNPLQLTILRGGARTGNRAGINEKGVRAWLFTTDSLLGKTKKRERRTWGGKGDPGEFRGSAFPRKEKKRA